MNNFKSGSGNLDFGDNESKEEPEKSEDVTLEESAEDVMEGTTHTTTATPDSPSKEQEASSPDSQQRVQSNSDAEGAQQREYPYFIRRNNVGDERDKRLEVHVRQKITNQEAAFRNKLAAELGTGEISKTDAREFALLAAFEHPEQVAELMREEGFGKLD